MGKGIWGIDVSKYSVKAVRIEATATGSILVTRHTVVEYPPAAAGETANLDDQIKGALADLKLEQKIGFEPVVFSLPSHSTFNRLIKLPPVDDAKIPEIVRYEAQQQIPFNIDEVIWDYQYIDRKYGPGEEKEVILFAIKRDIVEQFLGNIADLGFNVDGVQFGPVALFNYLLYDQDVGSACVALDMGGDNTDLIVIDGTKFWVRNLPVTGNDITKAIQKAFNIPYDEAENLKVKAAQSPQAQKIFNTIQPILRDLVNEINRSIGYYKSISKTSKFDKIVLLGNSTRTLNFQRFVSQSLQLPAVQVEKLGKLQAGPGVDVQNLNHSLTSVGTALGLALQSVTATANRVNLLPPAYIKKKEIRKKQPYLVGAVAALYILVGLMWYRGNKDVDRLKLDATTANAKMADVNQLMDRFNAVNNVDAEKKALATVVTIAQERDMVLKVMDLINPNIPDNGDRARARQEKLWVVDWKFLERSQAADAPPPPGHAAAAVRNFPTEKTLSVTLEVVISKRKEDAEGRNFIIRTLLNYAPGPSPAVPGTLITPQKPCVIKNDHWTLLEGDGWIVELDKKDLDRPLPSKQEGLGAEPAGEEESFWRYRVTLNIPVGVQRRKAPVADAKPAEKPQ